MTQPEPNEMTTEDLAGQALKQLREQLTKGRSDTIIFDETPPAWLKMPTRELVAALKAGTLGCEMPRQYLHEIIEAGEIYNKYRTAVVPVVVLLKVLRERDQDLIIAHSALSAAVEWNKELQAEIEKLKEDKTK